MSDTETRPLPAAVGKAIEKVNEGHISYSDLLDLLKPEVTDDAGKPDFPTASPLTEEQKAALQKVAEVFNSVTPSEPRLLTDQERAALYEERKTLDTVEKTLKGRKDDIRDIVLHHHDLVCQQEEREWGDEDLASNGHIAAKRRYSVPGASEEFSVEVRSGTAYLDPVVLEALAESDEYPDFTREHYLAMTEQTRIFNENRAMEVIKKHPEFIAVIDAATKRSRQGVSLYVRRAK